MRAASKAIAILAACMLLAAPVCARAQNDPYADAPYTEAPDVDGLAMAADLLLARPLGLVAMLVGATIFTVGLPIELMIGDVATPAQRLVADPARYTFDRPLGLIDPTHPGI